MGRGALRGRLQPVRTERRARLPHRFAIPRRDSCSRRQPPGVRIVQGVSRPWAQNRRTAASQWYDAFLINASMKFASWNVNSLKVRLPHLLEWLARRAPQIVCLQEIKLENAKFPAEEIQAAGYRRWLEEELKRNPRLALLGDYNIAPADEDVHDPKAWEGQILCSPKEREAFRKLLALGLKDSFRMFTQPGKSFTWWDYRMNGFARL